MNYTKLTGKPEEVTKIAVKEELQQSIDSIRILQNEYEAATNNLMPVVKEYLEGLIGLRMSFAREIQDIMRSERELTNISKHTGQLKDFCEQVERLKNLLDNNTVEKLKGILK